MKDALPTLERRCLKQLAEQRMCFSRDAHLCWQDRSQLLQSVATSVGVGKTFMANALGHIACRRRRSVLMVRADDMFKRLKAARLDRSFEQELKRLIRFDLLIVDDFALRDLDDVETQDFYELVVERHLKSSTVVTSNRDPSEWLAVMADALLAQSAIDRLQSAAYELVVEGESYRRRQKPRLPRLKT